MPNLVVTQGDNEGSTIQLSRVTCIGRGLDMDVRLEDLTASKRHARVLRNERGEYLIEDLGSSNGTFLNSVPVETSVLHDGDEIKVGLTVFRFVEPAAALGGGAQSTTTLAISGDSDSTSVISSVQVEEEDTWAPGEDTTLETLSRTNYRLRTLLDISQAIGTDLDEETLLNRILDNLFQVFPETRRGFIILRDPKSGDLEARATKIAGPVKPGEERLQISETILDYVVEQRRAVLSADAMSDERFTSSESIMELSMHSVMCAPLMSKGQVIGFIVLDAQRIADGYDEEGLTLLASIANQAALAISNALLHKAAVQRERIDQDLRNAHRIQSSFLPKEPPQLEGYEFVDWYGAALEVGGDFYDFVELPGGRVVIVVGDVSGKGISAALMMAQMTSNVRFFAGVVREPGQLLEELNNVALKTASDMFVTVLILMLDQREHTVTMANAGHCYPMKLTADGKAEIVEGESGFPVGIIDGSDFPETTFDIGPGEVVCVFTDGIIEAMNESQEQFGYEGLGRAVSSVSGGAVHVVKSIQQAMRNHTGRAPQSDDLTLVCFGREADGASAE